MFYIVDVDNTLVFTDQLNTAGYVYALDYVGLEPSATIPDRITKNVVREWYPKLTEQELDRITFYKQSYVRTHLEQTTLNPEMDHLLKVQGRNRCALWTAANAERVQLLLDFHNITEYKAIRFSDKSTGDVVHAIQDFCSLFQCEPQDLCFYDDDPGVIQRLLDYDVSVIAA